MTYFVVCVKSILTPLAYFFGHFFLFAISFYNEDDYGFFFLLFLDSIMTFTPKKNINMATTRTIKNQINFKQIYDYYVIKYPAKVLLLVVVNCVMKNYQRCFQCGWWWSVSIINMTSAIETNARRERNMFLWPLPNDNYFYLSQKKPISNFQKFCYSI